MRRKPKNTLEAAMQETCYVKTRLRRPKKGTQRRKLAADSEDIAAKRLASALKERQKRANQRIKREDIK